ncbi:HPr family phosphocarrier protein [Ruminiclostridium cellobioparum]|jgi:hypothetical protein|uniref:HPr family phosphocarrier protein n=1 Tax=Ruminiclostridium cellobioparum subsp. termitidis CT1112 TaxID=1195236 RepID=S0FIW4_RUMCE|nr:HPr family phosphocarrier protein [Ruminiclostridium cellobioparum]EMS69044.1 hypothetical protein CTER_5433 [Ruminiclostridium cellobioparum subsp. termitidis CT1112]
MVRPIKIKRIEDIENINRIVSRYPFDIWIHGKSGMADAKSILGMFILKLDEPLSIVVPDDEDTGKLFKELDEYMHIY